MKGIAKFQRDFDSGHNKFLWDWKTNEELLEHLQHGTIALAGEVGEFANIVKKATRENLAFQNSTREEFLEKMKEEITDVFIYLIKISDQVLKMDLEKSYFQKMEDNENKFKEFKV